MAPVVSFSDLPTEALDEIARRVGPLDNVLCSAVCRSWRRALKTTRLRLLGRRPDRPHTIQLRGPGGCWSTNKRPAAVVVQPIHRGSTCSVETVVDREVTRGRVIGCSHGWVVTASESGPVVDDDAERCDLHLLDPFTGRRFPLPPIANSARDIKKHQELKREIRLNGQRMYGKAALAPGRRLGTFAVMLIHSDGRGLSVLRPGARSWTTVRAPRGMPHRYVDVVAHKGAFCTVSCYGEVNAWVPDGGGGVRTRRLTDPRREEVCAVLAESPSRDDLLMVSSTETRRKLPHGFYYYRKQYEVSRCDERDRRWLPVKDLGETAILVGAACSLCVSTRGYHDAPRNNHLYFARSSSNYEYGCGHPDEHPLPKLWRRGFRLGRYMG